MKKNYYQVNAASYIKESNKFNMDEFNKYILGELKFQPKNPNILDLGFGSGREMLFLKDKGFNVKGIDSCKAFVENGMNLGLNVLKEELPSMNSIGENEIFDVIYSVGLIMHMDKNDRIELFKNIRLNLKISGFFIISYNTLDRTEDKERDFFHIKEEELNEEVGMTNINTEIMKDKRGFNWVTATFVR